MSSTPLAISVTSLSKDFRLPAEQRHTLKERVVNPRFDRSAKVFHALNDVSFDVHRGEFFGIVGRNGSGKSTLLKCLAGIYAVDSGSVRIGGRISTFIELGVGFNPDLAARDNVILNGIMLGLSPRQAADRVDEVIAFAELEDHVDLKLKNYSSGMQVRLAFAVMTQVDADVLLIDEVLAVGDAAFQAKCFSIFRDLRQAGKTIVLVTHDMASVSRFCDRAMLIEDGKIVEIGKPEEVGDRYLELNFDRTRHEELTPEPTTTPSALDEDAPAFGPAADGSAPPVQIINGLFIDDDSQPITTVATGGPLWFLIDVGAREPAQDLEVTFELRDNRNVVALGASTLQLPEAPEPIQASEVWRLAARIDVALAPGTYRLRAIARDGLTGELFHRSHDLCELEVLSVLPSIGLANLPAAVGWTKLDEVTLDAPQR